jgi:hypothetical protein
MNKQICYNFFAVLLHVHNMFAMGYMARCPVSSPASSPLMSPTISFFATIAYFVCYKLSGEVSGESPVCVQRAQPFFVLFCGWTVFCYTEAKSRFFCYPAAKRTRVSMGTRGLRNQIPGDAQHCPLFIEYIDCEQGEDRAEPNLYAWSLK